MGRFPQPVGEKGSKKWVQTLINDKPKLLNECIRRNLCLSNDDEIQWLSPLKDDGYAEYRDQAVLQRLGVELKTVSLRDFWPTMGPQWDALGKSRSCNLFLVEAKSHIPEMISTVKAHDEHSLTKIRESLNKTKKFLNVKNTIDWTVGFYQYTNRLAHLYLLRELNHLPAYLLFIYFINDAQMNGPRTIDEWRSAIVLLHAYLGLRRHKLQTFTSNTFIDVKQLM